MSLASHVLLVHGAWADGSSWAKVIPVLLAEGLAVTAVQLSLASLADDADTVRRAIAVVGGPVLLVGHSYGGAVVTEAGVDPRVTGLVYVAAFAPDAGQSVGSLLASVPPAPLAAEVRADEHGFLKLTRTGFFDHFAGDLTDAERAVRFASHAPTSVDALGGTVTDPAWRHKPSWFVVATDDHANPPALQRTTAAAIGARVTAVPSSHVAMLSHPAEVATVVAAAARQG